MDLAEFDRVAVSFAAFHERFAPLFGRAEAQQRTEQYLRGLLVQQGDRRNAENLAECVEGATARALQRMLTESPWSTEPVIDGLQDYLAPRLNTNTGIFIIDDTGFAKQGQKSVGVARQYSGTLGKVGNCQVGVFLAYVSERGQALVDKRLYLPKAWTDDRERCQEAGVPKSTEFQTKPELALEMLSQARAAGHLKGKWVVGDEGYGQIPSLRDSLDSEGWWYVLEMPSLTPVFVQAARAEVPVWSGQGPRPKRPRLLAGEAPAQTVQAITNSLTERDWRTLTVAEGAQGPRRYQFAARRVFESRDGLPGRETWLIWRRNPDGSELKWYFSNAPASTDLYTLGRVGAMRWPIETEFETAKGETGLDEYEVRSWQSWHHHITLALLAGAFLLTVQQDWGEKPAPIDAAAGQHGTEDVIASQGVDALRPHAMAPAYPTAQRASQTGACQTAPHHVQ